MRSYIGFDQKTSNLPSQTQTSFGLQSMSTATSKQTSFKAPGKIKPLRFVPAQENSPYINSCANMN